jgi:hypothetical protein
MGQRTERGEEDERPRSVGKSIADRLGGEDSHWGASELLGRARPTAIRPIAHDRAVVRMRGAGDLTADARETAVLCDAEMTDMGRGHRGPHCGRRRRRRRRGIRRV